MTTLIKPIKAKRISDQVFDQIKDLISRGELKPGTRLMPERELCQAMDVSRTVVREALQRLTAMGLLVQQQGRGTFVQDQDQIQHSRLSDAMDAYDASLTDLLEIRLGFECNAVYLAAKRASEKDVQALAKSIEKMESEALNRRFDTSADIAFHKAVAVAAKNPLHAFIDNTFNSHMFDGIYGNVEWLYRTPGSIPTVLEQHKAVFESIRKGQPDKALSAMRRHIKYVLQLVSGQRL